MGNGLNWEALEFLIEYHQVEDAELLVDSLLYVKSRVK